MDPNLFFTQLTAGAALAYLLRILQKWNKVSWINDHTTGISIFVRACLSFFATIGIGWTWNGVEHSLTITGLSAAVLAHGLWHWFGQYALQHGWGQIFNVGTVSTISAPVKVMIDEKTP